MSASFKTGLVLVVILSSGWGFFGHEHINKLAVFTLPTEMIGFYKKHIEYLVAASVNPDRRRYAVPEEAPRHYLDVENYGDSALQRLPKYYADAVEQVGEDSLHKHGIVPWHIFVMYNRLKNAFLLGSPDEILKYSAELGHYIADANVPLHTTANHNGQLSGQDGIHAFWESRLPELFAERYNFFTGKATYIPDAQKAAWDAVRAAHAMVDSVLFIEKELDASSGGNKYNYETKGKQTLRVYSTEYATRYHIRLRGGVEAQMRASIKMTGDFWYSAWVDAGQPDLRKFNDYKPTEEELRARKEELRKWNEENIKEREHNEK